MTTRIHTHNYSPHPAKPWPSKLSNSDKELLKFLNLKPSFQRPRSCCFFKQPYFQTKATAPTDFQKAKKTQPKETAPTDKKTINTWAKFGWTGNSTPHRDFSSLFKHPDCVEFLRKSGLLYTIRGYQHTLDTSNGSLDPKMLNMKEGIRLDTDGHPLLLVNGDWMRWENLKHSVEYDPKKKIIVSKNQPSEEWNYFSPNGLCQRGRYNDLYPIYPLSQNDQATLKAHGEKFFRGNVPQELQDQKKWHYMQVFTSHNSLIAKLSHVGLRLINKEGEVHSFGFETLETDTPFLQQYTVGSYNAGITSLDYDEFKPFKSRRVTTIPLTDEQYNQAMERVTTHSKKTLRFNRMHQNCAVYVTDIMNVAGHPVKIDCTLPELILDLGPRFQTIRKVKNAIKCFFQRILSPCVIKLITAVRNSVIAIAKRISSFFTNLLALYFGAGKGSKPDAEIKERNLNNNDGLHYFNRLIETWGDTLKNEPAMIYSPARLVNWQLDQASTYTHKYDGSPRFTIVPGG